ncbi:MAG TPA: hypothetical protein IAA51_02630 [Candidatus Cottocaccamicrobium excrementipullorum]|nr:hypothetical protein [Candidatus Cottocaccamicrobium excrementipullorum]
MDVQLCQRMLCDHGIFPLDVVTRPLRERLLMSKLFEKEKKELEEAKRNRNN